MEENKPKEILSNNNRKNLRSYLIDKNKNFLNNKSFMEFGVFKGDSLLEMYNIYNDFIDNNDTIFYGFDSFLGLPDETIDSNNPSYWNTGEFNSNGNIPQHLNKDRIKIIEGWFSDTLTDEFSKELNQKIGLLHIDCDIYTSTYQALDFCFKNDLLVSGSIIIYDDWGGYLEKLGQGRDFEAGEGLAHAEIMKKYNRKCNFIQKWIIDPSYYEIAIFILQ